MAEPRSVFVSLLVIFTICVSTTLSRPLDEKDEVVVKMHEEWMVENGRVYLDLNEKGKRYAVFKANVERIETLNKVEDRKFKLKANKFADLTNDEFRALHTGYKRESIESVSYNPKVVTAFRYGNVSVVPSAIDWRKLGAVNPVKDQASCGCCWAFSAVAAVEGITKLKKGKLVSLSEQELVDCDTKGVNQGCEGGLMDNAFQFIKKNNGLTTETNYPYKAIDGTCQTNKATSPSAAATITGYEDVPSNNENALMQAVAHQPVSIAIEGSGFDFQFYSSGLFTGSCDTYLDHAVTAVGYGVNPDGTKFWLIKNSWGTSWGEKGYMRIKKDVKAKEGLCGLAMEASYPTA